MRLLNLIVAAALVLAAGYVYKSKFAATVEAERVAKLRIEVVRERDRIAYLRAESAKLEAPTRIEGLARRHLPLKPLDLNQIDTVDAVPFRPIELTPRPSDEPMIANAKPASAEITTGSIGAPTPPIKPPMPSIATRPASPPVARRPALSPSPVASRHPPPSPAGRPVSHPLASRPVSPVIVRRPARPPSVTSRYTAPAAPRDPFVAPLRPPADIWTSEPAPEDSR